VAAWLLVAVAVVAGCTSATPGVFEPEAVDEGATAYIARVVADPEGDDLAEGAGEHVVISHDLEIRNDLGGWWIENADGQRLNLGIGTQIDPGESLQVHTGCGEPDGTAVFNCLDEEVLGDAGDVLVLRDAAGAEVDRFAYGDAG
jgi:micrococcal nuclease